MNHLRGMLVSASFEVPSDIEFFIFSIYSLCYCIYSYFPIILSLSA